VRETDVAVGPGGVGGDLHRAAQREEARQRLPDRSVPGRSRRAGWGTSTASASYRPSTRPSRSPACEELGELVDDLVGRCCGHGVPSVRRWAHRSGAAPRPPRSPGPGPGEDDRVDGGDPAPRPGTPGTGPRRGDRLAGWGSTSGRSTPRSTTAACTCFHTALLVAAGAFGDLAAARALSLDRTFGAFLDGELVGTATSFAADLAVPGGAPVPSAAVTRVGVLPTHTRRGILTALMAAQLEDGRARGDVVAHLRATEAPIYGRFGYGVATRSANWQLDRAEGALLAPLDAPGTFRCSTRPTPRRWCRPSTTGAGTAGPARSPGPPTCGRTGAGRARVRRRTGSWSTRRGRPGRRLRRVRGDRPLQLGPQQLGSPAGQRPLGGRRRGRGGAVGVAARPRPGARDRHDRAARRRAAAVALVDPRALRTTGRGRRDVAAVARRRRGPGVPLVRAGRRRGDRGGRPDPAGQRGAPGGVDGDGTGRTDAPADLVVDVAVLGAAWLGGTTWAELAAAGRVDVRRTAAVTDADRLFATTPAPWCGTFF